MNLIEMIDANKANGNDSAVDAVAMNVIRAVTRQLPQGEELNMAQLQHIGSYTRFQARKLTIDQQKQAVELVLKAVMAL